MKKITQFEDLDCWKKARDLVNIAYDVCDMYPLVNDYSTKDQFKKLLFQL